MKFRAFSEVATAIDNLTQRVQSLASGGGTVTESNLSFSDISTANVSTSKHGLAPKLPNDATKFLNGTGGYTVPSSGTGNVTGSTAVGSEPGTPASGDLDFYSNGVDVARYSGSAWVPWGPLFPFTAPNDASYAWVNQGGASVSTTNGGIFLRAPANAGVNLRIRKKAAPATPYTVTVAFLPTLVSLNYQSCGVLFRESSSGKVVTLHVENGTGYQNLTVTKWTNASTFSAQYANVGYLASRGVVFLRIADNGTNRISSYSSDGQHWFTFHTVGRTDFLTADEIGFYVDDETNTYDAGMTLLSWKEA